MDGVTIIEGAESPAPLQSVPVSTLGFDSDCYLGDHYPRAGCTLQVKVCGDGRYALAAIEPSGQPIECWSGGRSPATLAAAVQRWAEGLPPARGSQSGS